MVKVTGSSRISFLYLWKGVKDSSAELEGIQGWSKAGVGSIAKGYEGVRGGGDSAEQQAAVRTSSTASRPLKWSGRQEPVGEKNF